MKEMKEMKIIPVTIEDKINLVKWCARNFKSPSREVHTIFNTLFNNKKLLEKVKFVESNTKVSRALTIKSSDVAGAYGSPVIYTRDNNPNATTAKAINDLFDESHNFYIQLEFKDKFKTPEFVAALDVNPFVKTVEVTPSAEELEYINETLIKAREQYEKEETYKLIDKALDERDEDAFFRLTSNTIL
jgi:uncharacterized protein YpiB (UPF0302 family)